MSGDQRLWLAAGAGTALILGAAAWDLLDGGFWSRHALLASLAANLLVVAVTVVVVNEVLERRDRRRWNLLAQSVLFALIQSARATWMQMVEVLELAEVRSGSVGPLLEAAEAARDGERISEAAWELISDEEGRMRLQRICAALSSHSSEVIARWAPVMLGARPYAEMIDSHVELASRLEWLASVLAHNEPLPDQSARERRLTRSNVASERADELGDEHWLHDQLLAVVRLAMTLDYESREQAFSLVPISWWAERTTGLAGAEPPEPPEREQPPLAR